MDEKMPVQPAEISTEEGGIDRRRLNELSKILQEYRAGKARTEQRIIASENWWKLRNGREERTVSQIGRDGGFESASSWLHNVIVAKHADAMEAYPEPNILPREAQDREEARMLSDIVPCVLEQNNFEDVYSAAMWQKMKSGTGVYKVWWDARKLNGLGDIGIECVNPLNIYWEPGLNDIQKSPYFFQVELWEKDQLISEYPQFKDKLKGKGFSPRRYYYDDSVPTGNKVAVIDVYYKKSGQLHYIKYVGDELLYASEQDKAAAQGFYAHGRYPYVFDPLYPIEGSPCGYGFVDIGRNPQTEIDLLKTAFVKNAMVGATPRYFKRQDGNVNEAEFLDLSKPLVSVDGNLGEDSLRIIQTPNLDGNYMGLLDRNINELRETTGNTETSAGQISSGVTAASAIAALQEASGKGSRDSTRSSYLRYGEIVTLCIELIRQFYDLPRQFRITGKMGQEQFVSYSNAGIKAQPYPPAFGLEGTMRLPVFDVKCSAQKRSTYTKVTQNELALQFYNMGFFTPQMSTPALMCLDMMEFDGREELMQKISQQGNLYQLCIQFMQLSLAMAQKLGDTEMVQGLSQKAMELLGAPAQTAGGGAAPELTEGDAISGKPEDEPGNVEKARKRAADASQPGGGAK